MGHGSYGKAPSRGLPLAIMAPAYHAILYGAIAGQTLIHLPRSALW